MLEKAILIATIAHKGQIDKGGAPYIMHLIRVMNAGNTENEKICGILHDLIEDTEWTFEKLKEEGFDDEIIEALRCVTRLPNENYEEFIARIITNPLAIKIKLNDLKDNMDITRLSFISEEDCERLNKYLKAYQFLLSKA